MNKVFFILSIFAVVILLESSSGSEYEYRKVVLPINNDDPGQIGYRLCKIVPDPTITSIFLDGHYAYIADAFHNNVKKINLETFEITHSAKLPGLNPMPMDICLFNNKVYVTSLYDSVYVLDKDLNLLSSLYIYAEFEKSFVEISDDTLLVYLDTECKIVKIDKYNHVYPAIDTLPIYSYSTAHGKRYVVDSSDAKHTIETDFFSIELKERLPIIHHKFDAHNIEFDDHRLVIFDADTSGFVLFIYELKNE